MEDAIALYEAIRRDPSVEGALSLYETGRREEVEKTQHAADVSLVWFEHVARFWDFDPVQFAFGVMTRAKAITYDNLRLRAPDFVSAVDRTFAAQVRQQGFEVSEENPSAPMFQPFRLREMTLANRVVVSPMDMYSAKDGVPGDFHLVHYGARATGGAGLVFTEMTCVSPEARITLGCTGLWNDEQEAAWKRIVDFIHASSGAKFCLQLGHSGRKGATKLMWEGMDRPLEDGAWDICSASPIPYFPDSQVPREATRADMDLIKAQFAEAARRGERAGFDMLELHCAHGYLMASFLSPLTNRRTDEYGGSLENRLRFPLEVFDAMREVWPAHKPMSVRISATDWADGGITGDDAVEIARAFAEHGVDRPDRSRGAADLRAHVPDAVLRSGAQRSASCHHVRRKHHGGRSGEHDPGCGPRGSRGARQAASGRSVLHHESGRLVWRQGHPLPAAIPRWQGSDFPQLCPRPAGSRRAQGEGEAQDPSRVEVGGWREVSRGGMKWP
jgi:anthraniloyl-CoA monooxygenase